ncbi:glycosyltransferase [Microbacterium sulfonylureivorans]|uniref:glycosyltransferase n=1 Tax=Microbacterium sulfonylureivorans TaxID=2486854 RepID=UPI000FD7FE12|nr:glycosyltransferase [Microbacterium sulfonylureivorans]
MTPDTPSEAALPAVSVIVPAYNAASTIARQLEALSRQRVDVEWEVIVSDNGSTDRTADIARSWAGRLPLRVVDASARRGPSSARNAGAAAAHAPLLAFCDADDAVADDWLAHLLPTLEANDVVVTCARIESPFSTTERPLFDLVTTLRMPFLPELPFGSSSRLAVSAEAFRRVGRFDESLRTGEDVDLSWRLQLSGYRLHECRDALIDHHHRSGFIATVRQYAGYQRGRRELQHRYAQVIDEFNAARGTAPDPDWEAGVVNAAQPTVDAPSSRMGRVVAYLRDPDERRQFARRVMQSGRLRAARSLGLFLGRIVGRIDSSQQQVPASLARTYIDRERPFVRRPTS